MKALRRMIQSSLDFGRSDYEITLLVGSEAARLGLSPTQTWMLVKAVRAAS